jgi:hypothetical protein
LQRLNFRYPSYGSPSAWASLLANPSGSLPRGTRLFQLVRQRIAVPLLTAPKASGHCQLAGHQRQRANKSGIAFLRVAVALATLASAALHRAFPALGQLQLVQLFVVTAIAHLLEDVGGTAS